MQGKKLNITLFMVNLVRKTCYYSTTTRHTITQSCKQRTCTCISIIRINLNRLCP